MKIETPKVLETENIGGDIQTINAGIDASSLPFLFKMLSENFYSNPIGSIVREITSNCFDSHVEAGVDDPVIIRKDEDDEGEYISFIDRGVGLSPERIQKIYMNWFSSTKRETNDQIGGFGLGSKSPLSYTDYFHIKTVFEGKKYHYIFSKGESVPTIDLMLEEETSDRNGTEIRIYFKSTRDVGAFRLQLQIQLSYFDNVYFEGWNINNDYKIFESDTFKYRPDMSNYSNNDFDFAQDSFKLKPEMHIILGKVIYPIDWNQIGMKPFPVLVGIKFEIGEFQVTPNRESILYSEETKQLIRLRIETVRRNLIDLFNKQNEPIESFREYWKRKQERPYISFSDGTGWANKLYLDNVEGLIKKTRYKYFEDGLEFFYDKGDPLAYFYTFVGMVHDNTQQKNAHCGNITNVMLQEDDIYISKLPYTSKEKDWLIGSGYIFVHGTVRDATELCIGGQFYSNKFGGSNYFRLGIGLKMNKLMKALKAELNYLKEYRELTSEEKKQYREEIRSANTTLQRKLAGKVLVKDLTYNEQEYELSTLDINKHTGYIIYGFRADTYKLSQALLVAANYHNFWRSHTGKEKVYFNRRAILIVQINKQFKKFFKGSNKFMHVDKFLGDNPIFRAMASSLKIEEYFSDFDDNRVIPSHYIDEMQKICKPVGDDLLWLKQYYKQHHIIDELNYHGEKYNRRDLRREIMKLAKEHNLFDPKVEQVFERINGWYKGIEILRYIDINEGTLPYILKTLQQNRKRLNIEYYQQVIHNYEKDQLAFDFDGAEEEDNTVSITKLKLITNNIAC